MHELKLQLAFYKSIVDSLCRHFTLPDPTRLYDKLVSLTNKQECKIKKLQVETKELRTREKKQAKDGRLVQNMQMLVRDCLSQPDLAFKNGLIRPCADASSFSVKNQANFDDQSKTLDYSRM